MPVILLILLFTANRGGWDSTGVTTLSITVTNNTITCSSNHMTSFAVLVDVAGGHGVCNIVFIELYLTGYLCDREFQRENKRHCL